MSTKLIFNVTFTVQYSFFFAKNHTCLLIIDIQNNRRNLRMKFTKCFYKIVFGWQNRGAKYKNHHHLSTVITGAYQHMAKQSVSGVLIIGLYLK